MTELPTLRYRLLQCSSCDARTWTINNQPPPLLPSCHASLAHIWWERYTFFAHDNGPGLAPTQAPKDLSTG